jgi:hypothetical protein
MNTEKQPDPVAEESISHEEAYSDDSGKAQLKADMIKSLSVNRVWLEETAYRPENRVAQTRSQEIRCETQA